MKRLLFFTALLCAATLSSILAVSNASAPETPKKERAEVTLAEPMVLMGVTLKGNYLFVHDDAAMARGEACSYVYKGFAEARKNLVVSFHCKPVERDLVNRFTLRSKSTGGHTELTEFQFGGSTEGHLVPMPVQ